ncbi:MULTISPECIES: hypothetical protein [Candidatus Ichthyocystis]|uniref:hypothetical protein n=1 Tax=Candidatus Ichthyocystis TaxID=2929841 RepID=UPI000B87090E|nr:MULTISPECIES: hypothetical protein [Ichthyocystis]
MKLLTTSLSSKGTTKPNKCAKPSGTTEEESVNNEDVGEPAMAAATQARMLLESVGYGQLQCGERES